VVCVVWFSKYLTVVFKIFDLDNPPTVSRTSSHLKFSLNAPRYSSATRHSSHNLEQ
jgi:hypothetical protein